MGMDSMLDEHRFGGSRDASPALEQQTGHPLTLGPDSLPVDGDSPAPGSPPVAHDPFPVAREDHHGVY